MELTKWTVKQTKNQTDWIKWPGCPRRWPVCPGAVGGPGDPEAGGGEDKDHQYQQEHNQYTSLLIDWPVSFILFVTNVFFYCGTIEGGWWGRLILLVDLFLVDWWVH